jgi:hypothetical protein
MLEDPEERLRRLRGRPRLRSQGIDWNTPPPDAPTRTYWDPNRTLWASHYPETPWRLIDTSRPIEECLADALAYLDERRHA